jgi:hypothetical protein
MGTFIRERARNIITRVTAIFKKSPLAIVRRASSSKVLGLGRTADIPLCPAAARQTYACTLYTIGIESKFGSASHSKTPYAARVWSFLAAAWHVDDVSRKAALL